MKTNLLKAIAFAIVMTSCLSCTIESIDSTDSQLLSSETLVSGQQPASAASCSGSNPKTRLANNGTLSSDYEIYDSNGILLGAVYNVLPGSVSGWISFPEGNIIFNVTINSLSDQKVMHAMATCTELNMEIDANNQLTDVQPQDSLN